MCWVSKTNGQMVAPPFLARRVASGMEGGQSAVCNCWVAVARPGAAGQCRATARNQSCHYAQRPAQIMLSTTIFRISDGLPLAASVDDENVCPAAPHPLLRVPR